MKYQTPEEINHFFNIFDVSLAEIIKMAEKQGFVDIDKGNPIKAIEITDDEIKLYLNSAVQYVNFSFMNKKGDAL
jgi:hypothetical protein